MFSLRGMCSRGSLTTQTRPINRMGFGLTFGHSNAYREKYW